MTVASTAALARLKTALAMGKRAGANAAVADLLTIEAPLGVQWRSLANLSLHHGEVTLAIRAIDRFVIAMNDDPAAQYERGVFLARAGRLPQAREVLAQVDARAVNRAELLFARATVAMDLGEFDVAAPLLGDVVALRPGAGLAWLSLATIGGLYDDTHRRALFAAETSVRRAPSSEYSAWYYAVGRMHADRGEVDLAFRAISHGAALRRAKVHYDRTVDRNNAQHAIAGDPSPRGAVNPKSNMPILVTGLPRSGTTLVEQILSGHSEVAGGGELNVLRLVAQDVSGTSAYAVGQSEISTQTLRLLYQHLLAERFGVQGRVIDKSLTTSRFLGLALSIIPDMPVIWVRRDPLDCAWSCFRTHFAEGAPWSLDLATMAHHFQLEDALHAHWSEQLGERLLTIDYAALVEDPAAWTGRILAYCELPDEPAPYTPHLTRRAVTTSSAAQVRRPINRDGLGVAEPYRRHLEPFLATYQPV